MSSQNVSGLMAGLSLYAPQSPRGSKSQQAGKTQESSHSSQSQNRLPPVLKKYMNPGLVRPPTVVLPTTVIRLPLAQTHHAVRFLPLRV